MTEIRYVKKEDKEFCERLVNGEKTNLKFYNVYFINGKAYASAYPIEKVNDGMYMYCDNLWLKTKLKISQIAEFFSEYHQIEPYSISELTKDEKESVDIYMRNEK